MIDRNFPASYAAILAELVDQHGGDGDALLADSGLSPQALADPNGRCPAELLGELCRRALELTKEPALGLYFGRQLPLTAHGVLGYALLSCRNAGQALDILMKYYRLLLGEARLDFDVTDERVQIRYRASPRTLVDPLFDQEVFFAGLVAALSQLLHRSLRDEAQFSFTCPAPAHRDAYERVLGGALSFGEAVNEISLPASLLDEVPEFANPAMLKLYQEQCSQMLSQMEAREGLAAQVRDYLLGTHRRFPSPEETAGHFHISTRTLRRRLAQEETSFQAILDEVRRQLAERYLRDSALRTAQVAELLQFSDFSNFRRAFIRWTGMSPAQYRQRRG